MQTRELEIKDLTVEHLGEICACVCGAHRVGARVFFRTFANDADAVLLVGSFNGWSGSHLLQKGANGLWEISLSDMEISDGDRYKFKICREGRDIYVTDPYAIEIDGSPHFNSVFRYIPDELAHSYDNEANVGCVGVPVNIYELRADKWQTANGIATYSEIAQEILPYLLQMGYTHICLSGICESYYDHAYAHGETACFAPRAEQGGAVGLRKLIKAMHSSGIGVILEHQITSLPKNAPAESFVIENALWWLDFYGVDGFVIGNGLLAEAAEYIKLKRPHAYFLSRCRENEVGIAVKDCDAYSHMFSAPRSDTEKMRVGMGSRAYVLFADGKITTHMGCEIGQDRCDAEQNGVDLSLLDRRENSLFQLFVSDMNAIYCSHECLWHIDRTVSAVEKDGIAVIECSCGEEKLILALDTSGRGGRVRLPDHGKYTILLDSASSRYGGPVKEDSFVDTDRLILLPYGALVLKEFEKQT